MEIFNISIENTRLQLYAGFVMDGHIGNICKQLFQQDLGVWLIMISIIMLHKTYMKDFKTFYFKN